MIDPFSDPEEFVNSSTPTSEENSPFKESDLDKGAVSKKRGRPKKNSQPDLPKTQQPEGVMPWDDSFNASKSKENGQPPEPIKRSSIILTQEQKDDILAMCTTRDMTDITRTVFKNPKLEIRSEEGKAVKQCIAEAGGVMNKRDCNDATREKEKLTFAKLLTPERMRFIESNIDSGMTPLEMAKVLFQAPGQNGDESRKGSNMNFEVRAVIKYMKQVRADSVREEEELVEDKYSPPRSVSQLLGWVNEYVPHGEPGKTTYPVYQEQLQGWQKANLQALKSYLSTIRFIYEANKYDKVMDRKLYVSTFIRFTHDKSDLTPEEQDQYISAASETVNIVQISRFIKKLEAIIENKIAGSGDDNVSDVSIKWLELVNQNRAKLDTSKERLKKLLDVLTESRADRLKGQLQKHSSVIPLLNAWISEERRNEMIDLAKKEQEQDAKEFNKLRSVEDIQALIAGQTSAEACYGLQ